jgi:hypothetical protein
VVGLCVLAGALYWVGGAEVLAAIRRCTPTVIALATGAIVLGTIFGAWNCYRIAELQSAMEFPAYLRVFWRSWAVGISLPGQVADFVSTLWQLKGRTCDLNFVAGRLFIDKMITLALTLALLSILPAVLGIANPGMTTALTMTALVTGSIVILAALSWFRAHPELLGRNGSRFGTRLQTVLSATSVPVGMTLGNAGITCIKLILSGFAYWIVLSAIAPAPPSLAATTVISQSAGLIAYVPISFNGLGTVEISAVTMFAAAGVDSASVLSTYVIMRVISLTAAWLPTLAVTFVRPERKNR